jgi:UDP-N-acetylenolpyruvoylglucosamine reductase
VSRLAQPPGVVEGFPLGTIATVRTGGPAELFCRVGSERELTEVLVWAREAGLDVNVIGSGSNLLVADEGVSGLVIKLDRDLARIERDGASLVCGGGARLPSVAARAARSGLTGLEFGVSIPGSVGGAVRMNANAYGGQLARVLDWAQIVSATGSERRPAGGLGFGYRSSNLRQAEIVTRARFVLAPIDPARAKATLEQMRVQRHAAQPQGIKTFGSTFKNPDDPRAQGRTAGQLLAEAGCAGLTVGGARFAPKHANFVENCGSASTADVVSLMAEGRRQVLRRFGVELEPEVHPLGPVVFPWEPDAPDQRADSARDPG